MPSPWYQDRLSWMNVLPSSQKSYPGLFGVTGPTLSSGILKVNYALNWVCSRETLWDLCCSLLFCRNWKLVLMLMMSALTSCFMLGTWDDGVLAGNRLAVLRAFFLIQGLGPALGFHINLGKCELFARRGDTLFPSAIPCSTQPNLVILGAPVGDYIHCSRVIAELCTQAKPLLQCLQEMAGIDLQVAVTLLRVAGSYCWMVHLAHATPPNLALMLLNSLTREYFSTSLAVDVSDGA